MGGVEGFTRKGWELVGLICWGGFSRKVRKVRGFSMKVGEMVGFSRKVADVKGFSRKAEEVRGLSRKVGRVLEEGWRGWSMSKKVAWRE